LERVHRGIGELEERAQWPTSELKRREPAPGGVQRKATGKKKEGKPVTHSRSYRAPKRQKTDREDRQSAKQINPPKGVKQKKRNGVKGGACGVALGGKAQRSKTENNKTLKSVVVERGCERKIDRRQRALSPKRREGHMLKGDVWLPPLLGGGEYKEETGWFLKKTGGGNGKAQAIGQNIRKVDGRKGRAGSKCEKRADKCRAKRCGLGQFSAGD